MLPFESYTRDMNLSVLRDIHITNKVISPDRRMLAEGVECVNRV